MKHTLIGILVDKDGMAYNPMARTRAWATPADKFRTAQPDRIPIDLNHDGRPVGRVLHLERHASNLWCLGEVDHVEPTVSVKVGPETVKVPTELYWSAEGTIGDGGDVLLSSVAITHAPALVGQRGRPLTWFEGDLSHRSGWQLNRRNLQEPLRGLVERASAARYRPGPLIVHDRDQPPAAGALDPWLPRGEGPAGRLLLRSASTVSVTPSRREITVLAAPYEVDASVPDPDGKPRMVHERFARGAFDGVEHDLLVRRIPCDRDHDPQRLIGRVTAVNPRDTRGLVATIKLADTDLGRESLALARDDMISPSVCFKALSLSWRDRTAYEVRRAWLHSLGFTATPAYTGAMVLSGAHAG